MKPFASSADLAAKTETLEVLAKGVYALTAEGDPNVGAIEGEDFLVCIEARATPVVAREWIARLREHTDKPIKYLVLTHYHAVRVLGASAFDADTIISSTMTRRLIAERGMQDWASELGRMPRLFKEPDSIPGLTWPQVTFRDRLTIELGGDRGQLELLFLGRGHTAGDIVAWYDRHKVLFAGDLVEAQAALYTGDAFHRDWVGDTLDQVRSLRAEALVGGRGAVGPGIALHGPQGADLAGRADQGQTLGRADLAPEAGQGRQGHDRVVDAARALDHLRRRPRDHRHAAGGRPLAGEDHAIDESVL